MSLIACFRPKFSDSPARQVLRSKDVPPSNSLTAKADPAAMASSRAREALRADLARQAAGVADSAAAMGRAYEALLKTAGHGAPPPPKATNGLHVREDYQEYVRPE